MWFRLIFYCREIVSSVFTTAYICLTNPQAPAYEDVTKRPICKKPTLLSPLWQAFKFSLTKVALLKVAADVLAFTSPQVMK